VKNERRQSYENQPYGRWLPLMYAAAYPNGHPYSWPVIGSQEDLSAATLEDVKEFFRQYYSPSNLSLVVAGDFDPAEAKRLVQKYFGDIAPGPALDRPARWVQSLTTEKIVEVSDRISLERVYMGWPTPEYFSADDAAIDIAARVLADGLSSRLNKTLVYDKQLATAVTSFNITGEIASVFVVQATARPGASLKEIEGTVTAEITRLAKEGPTVAELDRARTKQESEFISGLERIGGFEGKSDVLNRYNTFELCNGLKPFLLRYLFASTDHRKLCYFDSDIFIFDSLDKDVWEALESCSILLTPHLCRLPEEDPDLVWRDLAVLQHGVYNGGFIGMRRSAEANEFLRWWASRIIACGYKKLEEGMNCDQRWLDLVPGFGLNVRISRHPGLNAAYWNLHERQFELREGRHAVNGEGLKFFHFSGYSVDKPEAITKHWTRFTFENRPDVRKIFDEYREHLTRASQASVAMKVTEGPHVFAAPGAGTVSSHHPEAQPKDRNVRGSQQERDSSAGSILSFSAILSS